MRGWHLVVRPRRWHLGLRVVGFVHPNGRDYRKRGYDLISRGFGSYAKRVPDWKLWCVKYHGVLIKNEWNDGSRSYIYPRYTVKCDDGRIRKFQFIRQE